MSVEYIAEIVPVNAGAAVDCVVTGALVALAVMAFVAVSAGASLPETGGVSAPAPPPPHAASEEAARHTISARDAVKKRNTKYTTSKAARPRTRRKRDPEPAGTVEECVVRWTRRLLEVDYDCEVGVRKEIVNRSRNAAAPRWGTANDAAVVKRVTRIARLP